MMDYLINDPKTTNYTYGNHSMAAVHRVAQSWTRLKQLNTIYMEIIQSNPKHKIYIK